MRAGYQSIKHPPCPSALRRSVVVLLAVGLLLVVGANSSPAARYTPQPKGSPATIPVGEPAKDYWLLSMQAVVFELTGDPLPDGYVIMDRKGTLVRQPLMDEQGRIWKEEDRVLRSFLGRISERVEVEL